MQAYLAHREFGALVALITTALRLAGQDPAEWQGGPGGGG